VGLSSIAPVSVARRNVSRTMRGPRPLPCDVDHRERLEVTNAPAGAGVDRAAAGDITTFASTRSSMPPTRHSPAAGAWTGRSIAPPGRRDRRRAAPRTAAAQPGARSSPARDGSRSTASSGSSMRSGRSGAAAATARRSCSRPPTRLFHLADEAGARSVAFPAISAGIYGYPLDRAASVALRAVRDGLARRARSNEPSSSSSATTRSGIRTSAAGPGCGRLKPRQLPADDRYPPRMTELVFPDGFLWGTATAAHQVEGGNSNSDWWEWELRPGTPCKEPSGASPSTTTTATADVALLAGSASTPTASRWSGPASSRARASSTRPSSSTTAHGRRGPQEQAHPDGHAQPLHPADVGRRKGGWLADATPALFERYVRRVVEALRRHGGLVLHDQRAGRRRLRRLHGRLGFPPGTHGLANWKRATRGAWSRVIDDRSAAVKELRPGAKVGQTHSMQEWESNAGGRPAMEYARRMGEDVYLEPPRRTTSSASRPTRACRSSCRGRSAG
jgi:hypothetical protein